MKHSRAGTGLQVILCETGSGWESPKKCQPMAKLRSTPLMTKKAWVKEYGDAEKFSLIVVDGYKWFTLASTEVHIWIRQPGESKINVDRLDGNGYASFCKV